MCARFSHPWQAIRNMILTPLCFDALMSPHTCAACFALRNCIFWMLLLSTYMEKQIWNLYIRHVIHAFFFIFNRDVSGWFACRDLKSCSSHDFHNSVSLNSFASKEATNVVIAGDSSKALEILLTALGKRWYRDFRLWANWLTLFHFSLVTVNGEGLTSGLNSHQLNPVLCACDFKKLLFVTLIQWEQNDVCHKMMTDQQQVQFDH